ncbi:MAG: hypothetical protein LAO03_18140 [Acidobacteriia bacterium]|nr:hypothetical protein [Terriglobia bacterium]
MEPVTAATTVWTIAKTAGEVSTKLFELLKTLKDRDAQQKVDEILSQVRELKHSASELEDQNRYLRDKLRFKSDEYEFRMPFKYHKSRPDQPLCMKCFAKNIEAQMGEPFWSGTAEYRACLVCGESVKVSAGADAYSSPILRSDFPSGR